MFKNRKFRFSAEIMITAGFLAAICYSMSYWQWERYHYKQDYFSSIERAEAQGRHPLDPNRQDWQDQNYAQVSLKGEFVNEHEVVLINRAKDGKPGVKPVVPFKLEGTEKHVLVDRGYLPFDLHMKDDKSWQVSGPVSIEGLVKPSQDKSFFLSPTQKAPLEGEWKSRWVRVEVPKMATQLPYEVLPIYVEQTSQLGTWPVFDPKEELAAPVHLNYTLQWLSFGTFTMLLAFWLQMKKLPGVRAQESSTPVEA